MLSFAVCDDDSAASNAVKSRIEGAYGSVIRRPIRIFSSGEDLLSAYRTQKFDIIVTEVVLPGQSGICTAKKIKRLNKNAIIIFYTSHGEYAIDGYEARAFRYILKSVPPATFLHQIKAAILEHQSKIKSILITNQRETISVKVDELLYAEVFNRIVCIYTLQGNYSYYAQLSKLEEELKDFYVVRTHKSYLVNLEYVKSIGNDSILLTTGQKLRLSKNYRASVENALADYAAGR